MAATAKVIPFSEPQDKKGRSRPNCANPQCHRPVRMGKNGYWLKYCADPQCPKTRWYHDTLSASARQNSEESHENSSEKDLAQALMYFAERMTAAIESIPERLIQQPLPMNFTPRQTDFADDDRLNLTIEEAKTEQNTSLNLQITTTLAMGGDSFTLLPLESLEYGLAQGNLGITAAMVEQKRATLAKSKPVAAKLITNIEIPANLEEVDLDW